jgi:hypothetical protein
MIPLLSKFPVASENGNIYRVDIEAHDYPNTDYYVTLYKEEISRRGKIKFVRIAGGEYDPGNRYNFRDWHYDFTKMAKHKVKQYEDSLETSRKYNSKLYESVCGFEKWDGVIKNEEDN